MSAEPVKFALLLRAFAELVKRSSSDELENLLNGNASLSIGHVSHTARNNSDAKRIGPRPHSPDLTATIAMLQTLDSRRKGAEELEKAQYTRRELEALARKLDLSVRKDDSVERLREKLVDATIGSRLNSRAIQGN